MNRIFVLVIVAAVLFGCQAEQYRGGMVKDSKKEEIQNNSEGYHAKTANKIVSSNLKNKERRERKALKQKRKQEVELNALNKAKMKQRKEVQLPFR